MIKKTLVNLNVRIPQKLKETINQHLKLTFHVNISEFTRDALREKLTRDDPQLYGRLFEETK
jgi:Arc/MetJ-type ribon-helix-helix transcriptional regulator